MNKVQDKVVLITGGAGGLGLAMINELLKNGAKGVSIADFSQDNGEKVLKLLQSRFGVDKVIFIQADITDERQFEEVFEKTIKTFKNLDIVINNAGIGDEFNWEKTFNLNLGAVIRGSYLAMQKYLPENKSGEEGVIVNIASVLGFKALQSTPVYCATKYGVVSLGQSLGGDEYYKRHKVRVLTLCPGRARTAIIYCASQGQIPLAELAEKELGELNEVLMEPEDVGDALIKVINNGRNGSLWIIENDRDLYEVVVPDRKTLQV